MIYPPPGTQRAEHGNGAGSLAFLRGFLRHPAEVASVLPSSPRLEQRLVQCACLSEARSVVELGPGTGGTTRALLAAMPAHARMLAVELQPDFVEDLQQSIADARLAVAQGNAEQLPALLREHAMPQPDVIVSGIPFSTMPAPQSQRIAACIAQVLRPGGRLVAYQVRAHVADFVTPHLGAPSTQWELMNVPPMRVFTWIKQ